MDLAMECCSGMLQIVSVDLAVVLVALLVQQREYNTKRQAYWL
jgi:hypothetical protein